MWSVIPYCNVKTINLHGKGSILAFSLLSEPYTYCVAELSVYIFYDGVFKANLKAPFDLRMGVDIKIKLKKSSPSSSSYLHFNRIGTHNQEVQFGNMNCCCCKCIHDFTSTVFKTMRQESLSIQ